MEDNNQLVVDAMWDDLHKKGYFQNDKDTFDKFFFAPGEEGYNNRYKLWKDLHSKGYLQSPTYEDFAARIGLQPVQKETTAPNGENGGMKLNDVQGTVMGGVAGGVEPGSYAQNFAYGLQEGADKNISLEDLRSDLETRRQKKAAEVQEQQDAAVGNVKQNEPEKSTIFGGGSSAGGGASTSSSRKSNIGYNKYTGILKTDPTTGEKYYTYPGYSQAQDTTNISELQGNNMVDEEGRVIGASGGTWSPKYIDDRNRLFLPGSSIWLDGTLKYRTPLDNHIAQAIDLGMKASDHSNMSVDQLKAKRNEILGKYSNGFTSSPESLQDAIDLNDIDYELTARSLNYNSKKEMLANRGHADFELNKARVNQDDLRFYERQGTNLDQNPLYVFGWQKLVDKIQNDQKMGMNANMTADGYIDYLMQDPNIENKFYAYTLYRASKNNRSWKENIDEVLDDFRQSLEKGENKHALAPDEKDVMAQYYGGELDRMDAEYEKELKAWQERVNKWSANRNWGGWEHDRLGMYSAETGDDTLSLITTAQNLSKDARNIINEGMKSNGGFSLSGEVGALTRGFANSAFDWRTWTFGVSDLHDNANMYNVAKKWGEGKQLTKAEQLLLDQMLLKTASEEFFKDYLTTGYEAGQTTGYALEFIVEMMTGAGAATDAAVRAMGTAIKKLGKKKVVQLLERIGMKSIIEGTLKKLGRSFEKVGSSKIGKVIQKGAKAGGKVLDEAISVANKGLGQTFGPGIAKVPAGAYEGATGQVKGRYNPKTGRMEVTGFDNIEDFFTSTITSAKRQFGENASEFLGDRLFDPGIKFINNFYRKASNKAFKKFGMGNAREFLDSLKGSDWYRFTQDFRKQIHYNGSFGEYCEEVANNIYNAAFVGDQNFNSPDDPNSVFNFKQNWRTYASCKFMSLAFGTANVIGYRTPKYRAKKDIDRADEIAKRAFRGLDWGSIAASIRNGSDEQVQQLMVDIAKSKKYNARQREAAIKYAGAVYALKGIEAGEPKKTPDTPAEGQLKEMYGRGYNMENYQAISDANGAYERAKQGVAWIPPEMLQMIDEEPAYVYEWAANNPNWSEQEKQQLFDYLNAKATYEGAQARLKDDEASIRADVESGIDQRTNKKNEDGTGGDNMIHPVVLKNGKRVYVTGGNVEQDSQGKVTSDTNDLIVVDEDNNTSMITSKDIETVEEVESPDEQKQVANDAITQGLTETTDATATDDAVVDEDVEQGGEGADGAGTVGNYDGVLDAMGIEDAEARQALNETWGQIPPADAMDVLNDLMGETNPEQRESNKEYWAQQPEVFNSQWRYMMGDVTPDQVNAALAAQNEASAAAAQSQAQAPAAAQGQPQVAPQTQAAAAQSQPQPNTPTPQAATTPGHYEQDDDVVLNVGGEQITGFISNVLPDGKLRLQLDAPINGNVVVDVTPEELDKMVAQPQDSGANAALAAQNGTTATSPAAQRQVNVEDFDVDNLDFENNYYVVHQTHEGNVQSILENGLDTTAGLNGTALFANRETIKRALQDMREGHGHRGSTALVIMKFPKSEFGENVRNLDDLSIQLMESGKSSSFEVPTPFIENVVMVGGQHSTNAQPSTPSTGIVSDNNTPIPMVDGKTDYSAATPERAHHNIYNERGLSKERADKVVAAAIAKREAEAAAANEAVAKARRALEKHQAKDIDIDNIDADMAEEQRLADALRDAEAQAAQAQNAVDYWKRVKDVEDAANRSAEESAASGEVAAPAAPQETAGETQAPAPQEESSMLSANESGEPSSTQTNEGESGEETTTAAEEELTPDERIERARMEALENRAEELAESCGLPVQVARSLDDLSDSHRRQVEKQHAEGKYVNGFYDPKTKQIVLFIPDIAANGGMRRLERTFLHEGVAHGGLRALFENAQNGIQTFDELCDQVWDMMPVAAQASMMNYIGVQKPEDMTQEKKRIAADEYMAHLAEWGVEQSVKTRIINAIKNALRKIGIKMRLNNNDIVSLLAASRRNLNEMDKVGINSAISEALDNDGEGDGEGVRMSTTAIFEGAGLEVSRDATDNEGKPTKEPLTDSKGNLVARIGDKEYSVDNPVTAADLKEGNKEKRERTVLQMLINDAIALKNITEKQADKIYQNYADLINMYLYTGSAELGGPDTVKENWEWLGDSVFRTIAANGDAQYSYSMDIIRVCKKNEAVIKAMSALQLREGRGATPSEIVELYRETHEDGYQVPCPVCYVFTRYIRNGKYASAAIKGMEKWGDHLPGGSDVWSVDQWLDALDKIQRETNPDYKPDGKNKMKGEELEKAKRFKKQLDQANKITVAYEKRVNALSYLLTTDDAIKAGTIKNKKLELTPERRASIEKELEIINEQYQHAVEIIAHQALSNWIKTHAIEEKEGKWQMREDAKKPEDIDDYKRNALDLRLTSNTIVNYPAIQRLRKSGGSAAGKEISFASDNRLGEVVSGLGINKTNLSGYKNKYEEALNATGRAKTKARNEARKRFKDATVYALMQTLRGGQRMWSWSDNIERLSPDIAINIMQLQLLGGAMQTYSKQLEGIKLAAQMGAYVNGSLMAKDNGYQEVANKDVEERDGRLWLNHDITDEVEEYPVGGGEPKPRKRIVAAKGSYVYQAEDGKKYVLIYDDVVGVDPFGNELHGKGKKKGLFKLNQEYDRAGNILVGMNDLHVRAAMADPRVFFIIPWHASGANNHILNQMLNILEQTMTDRLDYTAMQEEKNMLERNKNTKELPEVNKRLRDLWEEGRQWAKENKWKSGMEVDSNGDVITESQYMYRQLRAQIFNGNIFEAMPSEEQYRAAVEVVNSMQATMDELNARNEQWKAKSPEYKKSPEGKAEKKEIDDARTKANKAYNPAVHTIELHDGLIDWRDSSQHEGDAEWQEQHPKRINVEEARRMIENDEFLSQVLKRVEPIGHMTNGDNTYIYPYEYWKETDEKGNPADIKDADINGKRYVEYCRRMGYKPKFSGRWGDKVTEENMNDGNFVHDPGYWKLLIDRRMYDRKGKYQWLDPVEGENFEPDLVNPLKTGEEFNITQVADDKDAEDIAERVYNNMAERDGGVAKVDYSKPLDKIMDEYDAALAAGVQANVKLTDAEEDALEDMEEAMAEEGEDSGVMFSTSPTFYSNAERAVENIKQNKATAEQWLAMIKKNGGLKAGEDKWMGLSQWLEDNKGKSLTKDEVLQFVRDNGIQMEEVEYGDIYETPGYVKLNEEYMALWNDAERIFQEANKQFADYVEEMEGKYGDDYYRQMTPQERQIYNRLSIDQELRDPNIYSYEDIAFREMVDRYGDDFEMAFRATSSGLDIEDSDAASYFAGDVQNINETRLDYTTDGLENKREIAFVVPNVESYQENDEVHFGPENQGKAVMWVRFGETTDADGNRVLVIDEIQSNRHQDAREKGYKNPDMQKDFETYRQQLEDKYFEGRRPVNFFNLLKRVATPEEVERYKELSNGNNRSGVPAAPFEKNWHEVAMKRMLRLAAEEGFDKVAWTTGEQQAERYNLGGVVEEISVAEWNKPDKEATVRIHYKNGGSTKLIVDKTTGIVTAFNDMSNAIGKPLSDVLGKELTQKILDNKHNYETWSGDDLRIGGEGMKGFYDQMLPRFMNKYGKRWGVKVEDIQLDTPGKEVMHSVDVTPEMKESVMQGQPLFSTGWHGSGSEFDRFDHSHMGEGEGAQAYGWGTYITNVEGIGRSYATESAKKNPTYYWKDQQIDRASINPLSMAYDVVEREGTIKKAISLVDRFLDNPDAHENWAKVKEILKQSKKSDFTKKPARYLYEVEIPDNNGENYISWNETLPKKHRRRIANVVRELPDDLLHRDSHGPNWLRGGFEQLANTIEREQYAGKEITERLRDALGNSRAVSEIFSKAGFVGTEYPAQYLSGGRKDGAKNYVIYNEDDVEIKDRIRFSTSAAVAALKDDERVYNDLLGKVFSGVSNETRRGIVGDAMENRGYDFGAATEAWLMGLADDEAFAQVPQEDWRAVKNALGNALRENGVEGSMTDNEARYVLWKAGQIEDGVFSMAEDIVKRDELLNGASAPQYTDSADVRFSTSPAEQIYSDNFKNWFGDWENDPENASKVVDENGRPKVVYHQTNRKQYINKKTGQNWDDLDWRERDEWDNRSEEEWEDTWEEQDFYTFDNRYGRQSIEYPAFFFAPEEDPYHEYGERTIAVYLDIKNPAIDPVIPDAGVSNTAGRDAMQALIDQGYDGVIRTEDGVPYEYIAFYPEQIKSATENNGDFSRENPDIRFSVTPRDRAIARDQYDRMMRSGRYQFVEAVQDSMLGLKKLMEAIMGDSYEYIEDIPMYENPYITENLMSSSNAAQQHEYSNRLMAPILKEINKLTKGKNKARNELIDYMMAKHGLERNQVLADRDAKETAEAGGDYQEAYAENRERDYAGLTALTGEDDVHAAEAKAQQMVAAYEQQHDTTELWGKVNAATKTTLAKLYQCGIMSKETYQKTRDMFEYYIPLRGYDEKTSDKVYGYLTSKDGPLTGGSIMKRAGGRTSKADDPFSNIAMMADKAITEGNRNLMKQTFLNFVRNHPSDAVSVSELWLQYDATKDEWVPVFPDIPADASPAEVEQITEQFEADMQQLAQQEPDKYKHGRETANIPYKVIPGNEREHQVLVKMRGQTYVLTINGNPRAAQAINGLTNPDTEATKVIGKILEKAQAINRGMSAVYTTMNPDFVVSNFLRDMYYANTMVYVKEKGNYGVRFNANVAKLNPLTIYYLLQKWENGTLNENRRIEKLFKEFMLNGGETGYTTVWDVERYKKSIDKELRKQNNIALKAMGTLGGQLEMFNRSVENVARFAAFVTSVEMGRSYGRAAYDAKEISVNFNKKGSGGTMFGATGQTFLGNVGAAVSSVGRQFFVFWNAGVQGMTNFGRNTKRHPVKGGLGAASLFGLGILIPLLAGAGGGDGDDEDKNAYYNLPEYIRRSNLCIYADGKWVTIPLPVEYRAIYGLGELAYGVVAGKERYSDEELAMQISSQFSQLLPIDMLEGGGGWHPFIPTLLKPIVETGTNTSWSGLPIHPDSPFDDGKYMPEYTKVYQSTDKDLIKLSEFLNRVTGGNGRKKGLVDINPANIEYWLNGYLGGLFTFPIKVKKSAETAFGDREFEWKNIPFANRVIKEGDERTEAKKLKNEFFKYKEEYEETKWRLQGYGKDTDQGVFNYAKELAEMNYSKEYGRYVIFDKYAKDFEDLEKIKKRIADGTLPAEMKQEYDAEDMRLKRQLVQEMHAYEDGKYTPDKPKAEDQYKPKDEETKVTIQKHASSFDEVRMVDEFSNTGNQYKPANNDVMVEAQKLGMKMRYYKQKNKVKHELGLSGSTWNLDGDKSAEKKRFYNSHKALLDRVGRYRWREREIGRLMDDAKENKSKEASNYKRIYQIIQDDIKDEEQFLRSQKK